MNEESVKIREMLLKCYGVDIEEAKCHFSTQNYAYIFPNHPYMIRVKYVPNGTGERTGINGNDADVFYLRGRIAGYYSSCQYG